MSYKYYSIFHLILLSSLLVILSAGCTKWKYPDHIIAGEISGRGIYYSGLLNIECYHAGDGVNNSRGIDIDNNGDIECALQYYVTIANGAQYLRITISPKISSGTSFVITDTGSNEAETISANTVVDENMI